jgi:hypothetical protein
MPLIQVLIVAFALFAVVRAIRQFRGGHLPVGGLLFWVAFWILVSVITLLPQTTSIVAAMVGVGRGADLVIYASLIVLFYLVFRVFVKIEDTEREITKLVRKIALEDFEEKKR